MAKEDKVINIIKKRIQEAPDDSVFFNNSFPEFDDEYVGQILSSLSKQGVIHHLSRGVYVKAIETRFGFLQSSFSAYYDVLSGNKYTFFQRLFCNLSHFFQRLLGAPTHFLERVY